MEKTIIKNGTLIDGTSAEAKEEQIRLYFPKFTLTDQGSLKESLIQLGLDLPFSTKADF